MKIASIKSYVGYAVRARKAVFGVNNIIATYGAKRPDVVLYDNTLSANSKDKLLQFLLKNGINGYCIDLEEIYPNKNCKALGVIEKNLAAAIIKEMKEFVE